MNKSLEIVETKFGNFIVDEYDLIGNTILRNKVWEHYLYVIYSEIIKGDYYCVDAGANLGFHSVQFGRLGKKVYAFEPQSYIYNQLCTNILLNNLDYTIEPYKLGLGDKEETKQLWNIEHESKRHIVFFSGRENSYETNAYNWGGRGVIQENYGGDRATENELREEDIIKLITLDSLNIPKCDFMKIDIQGYEYNMIIGAKNLINTFKPTIFLENNLGDGELSFKVKEYLINSGYDFYRMHLEKGEDWDCILTHPDNINYNNDLEVINKFTSILNITKE